MTPRAWFMLVITWSVVATFCGRFLWAVLRRPPGSPDA